MADLQDLRNLDKQEIAAVCEGFDWPRFRGGQVFSWVHEKGVKTIEEMTNLSREQRQMLAAQYEIGPLMQLDTWYGDDGDTVKFLWQLPDGNTVEQVLMFYSGKETKDRVSTCVSTQTGCAMGCKFCATAMCGRGRNLTAGEIVGQILLANDWCRDQGKPTITNVVYMGMGEPLANWPQVKKSLQILNDADGLNIGWRRMTISTCGLADKIKELAEADFPLELSVSLHSADDNIRSALMPINDRYPLACLMAACDEFTEKTGRRITYEYAMFRDVNDSKQDAEKLCRLLRGRLAFVNIIPANPVAEAGFFPARSERIKEFVSLLERNHIAVAVRHSRGQDIEAACGQLKRRNHKENQELEEFERKGK